MAEIKLNLKNSGIAQKSILAYKEQVENIHKDLHRRANDKNDFDTVLKDYVAKNPQYLEGSKVKIGTSLPLNGGGDNPLSVNQLMNNAILSAVGKNKI